MCFCVALCQLLIAEDYSKARLVIYTDNDNMQFALLVSWLNVSLDSVQTMHAFSAHIVCVALF